MTAILPPPPPPPPPRRPPPPPPPPLLPPPPPPPPPAPDSSSFSRSVQRRSKMRSINWDAIPCQSALGKRNVFTCQGKQQDFVLDTRCIEELFSHADSRTSQHKNGFLQKSVRGRAPSLQAPQAVAILNSKKSMNVGIFLKQFKRPVKEVLEDIRQGNWLRFGAGKLKELCKLLPEEGEIKQLLAFRGDVSLLPEADHFMVQLVRLPAYEERLRTLMLREEFFPLMEELKQSIAVLSTAANELLDCDDLHSIIRLVLKAGNYMNAGGYAGSAIGFRMTSLLKLVDTKANKPGMNLMHYVAMQAQEIDVAFLEFPSQLEHIGMAARIHKQEVESDFHREVKKVKEAKMEANKQPDLQQQMETFLMRAEARLADVEASLMELRSLSRAVAEFFCEDPGAFQLEECCLIFHCFCDRFNRAVQENREREAAEQRRLKRERLGAAKRRSTATCSASRTDLDAAGLESVLHTFLSSRLARRRTGPLSPVAPSPTDAVAHAHPLRAEAGTGGGKEAPPKTESDTGRLRRRRQGWTREPRSPPEAVGRVEEAGVDGEGVEVGEEVRETSGEEAAAGGAEGKLTPKGQRLRTSYKRAASIDQKRTPTSSDRRRRPARKTPGARPGLREGTREEEEEEEEERENKEEAQRIREVSRKVLHFQNSRGNLLASQDSESRLPPDTPAPAPSTPRPQEMREVDLALRNSLGNLGSPWTILSPGPSPRRGTPQRHNKHTPSRRHSFTSHGEYLDEGIWALPVTPSRPSSTCPSAVLLKGRVMSEEELRPLSPLCYLSPFSPRRSKTPSLPNAPPDPQGGSEGGSSSLPDCPAPRACSWAPVLRTYSLDETRGAPAPSFSLGDLFQRRGAARRSKSGSETGGDGRPGTEGHLERPDASGIVSFFRRLGDRGRRASVEEQDPRRVNS
ncbi:FH2 domain containing 3 [Osmerus mordax]|uniref:FH2 domain containing 3 n=1 Tax=Osmerus mordax TaxID=8014 RepID=UPI00350EDFE6